MNKELETIKNHIKNSLEYIQADTWITDKDFNELVELEYTRLINTLRQQPSTPQEVEQAINLLQTNAVEGLEQNQNTIDSQNAINTIRLYAFPQLSEGMEKAFEVIENEEVHFSNGGIPCQLERYGDVFVNEFDTIKQHILALQQENNEWKEKFMKVFIDEIGNPSILKYYKGCETKLNAIREYVYNEVNSMNEEEYTKIKSLLESDSE
jgi:hypothetical protein